MHTVAATRLQTKLVGLDGDFEMTTSPLWKNKNNKNELSLSVGFLYLELEKGL